MNISGAYNIFLIEGNKSARDIIVELGVERDTMRKALCSKNPTIKTLAKYCAPLGIKVSELIAKAESLEVKRETEDTGDSKSQLDLLK